MGRGGGRGGGAGPRLRSETRRSQAHRNTRRSRGAAAGDGASRLGAVRGLRFRLGPRCGRTAQGVNGSPLHRPLVGRPGE